MLSSQPAAIRGYEPPFVKPLANPNFLSWSLRLLTNNLAAIPQTAYEQDIVVAKGPPTMIYCMGKRILEKIMMDAHFDHPHGDIMREVLGPLIGGALPLSERENWVSLRRIMAPFFSPTALARHDTAMLSAARRIIGKWRHAPSREPRDIFTDLLEAAFFAAAQIVLGRSNDALEHAFLSTRNEYFEGGNWRVLFAALQLPHWVPRPKGTLMSSYEDGVRTAIRSIVEARRKTPTNDPDLLNHFLSAGGPECTDDVIVDNLTSIMIGSFDTIAITLSWAIFLVSQNPEIEERLLREIKTVAGIGPIDSSNFEKLTLVQNVVLETMRLFPATPQVTRNVLKDFELDGTTFKAGSVCVIPFYAINRHSQNWDKPNIFDPDRFLGREWRRERFSYMPFGAGPRICIGAAWAMMEQTIMLAEFVRAARFQLADRWNPEPIGQIFLLPKGGMKMHVAMR